MAVALIDSAVPSETVNVLVALDVPDVDSLTPFDRYWQRPIVLADLGFIKVDVVLIIFNR